MQLDHPNTKLMAPTRAAGEATLRAFAPRMGKGYTNGRNHDRGAGKHRDVSMLWFGLNEKQKTFLQATLENA